MDTQAVARTVATWDDAVRGWEPRVGSGLVELDAGRQASSHVRWVPAGPATPPGPLRRHTGTTPDRPSRTWHRVDQALRSFVFVTTRARHTANDTGPLNGFRIGLKDLIATDGMPTHAGTTVPDFGWRPSHSASAAVRLIEAGAHIVGKTSTMEFGLGLPDPADPLVPRNPWDLARWSGGSSSGSASAVAAGLVDAALGTDTAGSLRVPAAYCGVTALKPTRGRIDLDGVVALAPSLDVVGPIATSAAACARLLSVLERPVVRPSRLDRPPTRVGWLVADGAPPVTPDVAALLNRALRTFRRLGYEVVRLRMPSYRALDAAVRLVLGHEAYLAHSPGLRDHRPCYQLGTVTRLEAGRAISQDMYERAMRLLSGASSELAGAGFVHCDLVLTPTSGQVAPRVDDLNPIGHLDAGNFTQVWSGLGLPAVAFPVGLTSTGLPVSMQAIGEAHADFMVLQLVSQYQELTQWHEMLPLVNVLTSRILPPTPGRGRKPTKQHPE